MAGVIAETRRLILRELQPSDFDALYDALADEEVSKYYPYVFDEARVHRWIDWSLENYRKEGFGLWAVCLKETGRLIGDCGLTLQNIDGRILPEIGFHIRRDCWRKGYATEAAIAVRDWAFQHTAFDALYSYCTADNVASYKTAEAAGLHFDHEYTDATGEREHVSVIYRKDFLK